MDLKQFIQKYIGQKVDFDGAYGAQCVDLFRQFCKDVLEIPHTGAVEGAKDLYLRYNDMPKERNYFFTLKECPSLICLPCDVAVWDASKSNKYGHVAIVVADYGDSLIVFEQDGFKQDGAKMNLRSKKGLLGVLRMYGNV